MTAERVSMQTIGTILWLYYHRGLRGRRPMAQARGCRKSAVKRCLYKAHERGVEGWP
jgi:DNA-binding transcriptional regulator LsrR (DeoR family)